MYDRSTRSGPWWTDRVGSDAGVAALAVVPDEERPRPRRVAGRVEPVVLDLRLRSCTFMDSRSLVGRGIESCHAPGQFRDCESLGLGDIDSFFPGDGSAPPQLRSRHGAGEPARREDRPRSALARAAEAGADALPTRPPIASACGSAGSRRSRPRAHSRPAPRSASGTRKSLRLMRSGRRTERGRSQKFSHGPEAAAGTQRLRGDRQRGIETPLFEEPLSLSALTLASTHQRTS